jgi:hypothetical protein
MFSVLIFAVNSTVKKEEHMGSPVIVDDGGSTRIKRMSPGIIGEMDKLLDVTRQAHPVVRPGSPWSEEEVVDNFSQVRIVYQERDGASHEILIPAFQKVQISSHFDQNVILEKAGNRLKITLFSDVVEPMVESRQHDRKRRYIVSNSGAIEAVTVDGVAVYDTGATGGATVPAGISKPVIYTSVVLT